MKNILAALLAALVTAVSCGTQPPATEPDSESVSGEMVQMTETFADKLNAQMPQDKNYMFSPLSVKMALALAARRGWPRRSRRSRPQIQCRPGRCRSAG